MGSSPAPSRTERLPLLTRCLLSRVRLMALEAQVAAGGPARDVQLERAIEPVLDGLALPATSTTSSPIGGGRRRPGHVAGEALANHRCSSEKDDEKSAGENPKEDKKEGVPCFRDILPRKKGEVFSFERGSQRTVQRKFC